MPYAPNETTSIWQDPGLRNTGGVEAAGSRELLPESEVCVIGAGIAGLTIAYLLQKSGKRVQVLDAASSLGAGETGRTTAHLSAVLDDNFCRLEQLFGPEGMRLAVASHAAAIDCIQAIVETEHISCDFERLDGLLVAAEPSERELLEKEAGALRRAGFSRMQSQESIRDRADPHRRSGAALSRPGHLSHRPVHAGTGARFHAERRTSGVRRTCRSRRGEAARRTSNWRPAHVSARATWWSRPTRRSTIASPCIPSRPRIAPTWSASRCPGTASRPFCSGTWPIPITTSAGCAATPSTRSSLAAKITRPANPTMPTNGTSAWSAGRGNDSPGSARRDIDGRGSSWSRWTRSASSGAIRSTMTTCTS